MTSEQATMMEEQRDGAGMVAKEDLLWAQTRPWLMGLLVFASIVLFFLIMGIWSVGVDSTSSSDFAASSSGTEVPLFVRIGLPICTVMLLSVFSIGKQKVVLPLLAFPCLLLIHGFVLWLVFDDAVESVAGTLLVLFIPWLLTVALIVLMFIYLRPFLKEWISRL